MKLLFLSNGHGEDVIATRIIEQLQKNYPYLQIAALPIVGEGHAYRSIQIPIISLVQQMPSGGFIYQDRRELWRDIQGGLLGLTLTQFKAVRQWGEEGGKIIAVGDIVPLFMAWFSGGDYGFVGTAKSEYYIQDQKRGFSQTFSLENLFGSIYFPWERWLMKSSRCCGVFPRDQLTAEVLQKKAVNSYDLGNPMMDEIEESQVIGDNGLENQLTVLLLPGSRCPEAQRNWELILIAVESILQTFNNQTFVFLAAITPSLSLDSFTETLLNQEWQLDKIDNLSFNFTNKIVFIHKNAKTQLILTQQNYADCLKLSQAGIAMAGTATEQFVGLGKPVFTFPGQGPQFTYRFAEAQTRLLGKSVILLEHPSEVGQEMAKLLQDLPRLQALAENGRKRMGKSGASQRIAQCLITQCFSEKVYP